MLTFILFLLGSLFLITLFKFTVISVFLLLLFLLLQVAVVTPIEVLSVLLVGCLLDVFSSVVALSVLYLFRDVILYVREVHLLS